MESHYKKGVAKHIFLASASAILIVYGWSQKFSQMIVGPRQLSSEDKEQCVLPIVVTEDRQAAEDREGLFISCGGFF